MKTKLFLASLFTIFSLNLRAQTTLTTAADFTETDIHGNTYNLFSILNAGKYVCIDFYATWCIPCQNTVPYFKQAYENYGCNSAQVVFMSVSEGQPPDDNAAVFAFDNTYLGGDPGYPGFSSVEGNGSQIAVAYNIQGIPSYILIAPNHNIVEQQMFPISSAATFDSYFSAQGLSYASCATGINDLSMAGQNSISVFPNPFSEKLNIVTNEPSEIILYDITSRKLLQQIFENSTTLNTEQLAKGIYLYEIRNKNGVIENGKVVKD